MTVAELIEVLRECDPTSQVGFVEGDVVTSIGFVEQKVGVSIESNPPDPSGSSEVFLYEEEPYWPDFDLYAIKTLASNAAFAKNAYTKLPD